MSSNITVQKICIQCKNEFTARTTVTQFCSKKCNTAYYKAKHRSAKVEAANKHTLRIKIQPIEDIKAREFLSVLQVSNLLGCSKQNIYNLIKKDRLKATNILKKKTIIRRSDIDKLFEKPLQPEPMQKHYEINECYTIGEAQKLLGISEKAFYETVKRNNVPKIKQGKFVYVPKELINNIFNV